MRRAGTIALLVAVGLSAIVAAPDQAWAWRGHRGVRTHVVIGIGPWWGPVYRPYPYWYWYGPPPFYVYYPPPVIVQEPPVYVQRPAPPTPPPEAYWYYCPSARAYYPDVQRCPEAWVKVPPRSDPPGE